MKINFISQTAFKLLLILTTLNFFNPVGADLIVSNANDYSVKTMTNLPHWLTIKRSHYYDGDSDDLVTAGWGFTALSSYIQSIQFVDNAKPTFQELRKAKLNRFIQTSDGEGQLFGFHKNKLSPLFDGKIAGYEILATLNNNEAAFLLQIPVDFDKKNPCIIAVPSLDSDGLYNAQDLQIRGLWGLHHNCAVVYNDKGLGNGIYNISQAKGYTLDGKVQSSDLLFNPNIENETEFNTKFPNRFAVKAFHSKQNPERKWGEYIIRSIQFAFYVLNQKHDQDEVVNENEQIFTPDNTKVLVYGEGDGAGAALRAGELDSWHLIDGIVAVNPQIMPDTKFKLNIVYGKANPTPLEPKSIANYMAYAAMYLPCAIPAIEKQLNQKIPYVDRFIFAKNRCTELKQAGFLSAGLPIEALAKLQSYGWSTSMLKQLPYFYYYETIALPYQYISSYGRFDVTENMCDFSISSMMQGELYNAGQTAPLHLNDFQQFWSKMNGRIPLWLSDSITGLDLVSNVDPYSPHRELFSSSEANSVIDYNTKGAICLFNKLDDPRVKKGIEEVKLTGHLNHIKTIIVHGKNNVKQLPNNTSRAYLALNSVIEKNNSQLRYIEVENSSYFNNGNSVFKDSLLDINFYAESAMNLMWKSVTQNNPLPESQLVKPQIRMVINGFIEKASAKHYVPISLKPEPANKIIVNGGTIWVPSY